MKKIYILIGVLALFAVYVWTAYNGLVTKREAVSGQWAQVETQYQRRFDLIPNLVEAVKGTMEQEQTVFGAIADARTKYSGAQTTDEKAFAASEMESSFARLLVIMENYPQLKSAENVQTLMAQIEGTENRVGVERGRYNDAVKEYNLGLKRFPSNLVAGLFGFGNKEYFEAASAAAEAPAVQF